jgi:hypothetical protein
MYFNKIKSNIYDIKINLINFDIKNINVIKNIYLKNKNININIKKSLFSQYYNH